MVSKITWKSWSGWFFGFTIIQLRMSCSTPCSTLAEIAEQKSYSDWFFTSYVIPVTKSFCQKLWDHFVIHIFFFWENVKGKQFWNCDPYNIGCIRQGCTGHGSVYKRCLHEVRYCVYGYFWCKTPFLRTPWTSVPDRR